MNRKLDLSGYMHGLLGLYVVWLMATGSIDNAKTVLALGLIAFAALQQYLQKLNVLKELQEDMKKDKDLADRRFNQVQDQIQIQANELNEVKKTLVSTRSINQITAQQNRF